MAKSATIAQRYARAWLAAAEEQGVLARVRVEIEGLGGLIRRSPEFAAFLQDRTLAAPVKQQWFVRIFQGKVEQVTLNVLLLLTANRREPLLPAMLDTCHALLDERDGIVTARVTSAVDLTPDQQTALQHRLEAYTGKRVRMMCSINPALVGGFVAAVNDTVFDGSLAAQLKRVKRALVGR